MIGATVEEPQPIIHTPVIRYKFLIKDGGKYGWARINYLNIIDWGKDFDLSPELGDKFAAVVLHLQTNEIIFEKRLLAIYAAGNYPINYWGLYGANEFDRSYPYRPDEYYRQKNT